MNDVNAMTNNEMLTLRVSSIRAEARDVVSLELRAPDNSQLPEFTPGSHLEIYLPPIDRESVGLIRHYSLCNASSEKDRYVIAVGLSPTSRGGSNQIHNTFRVGLLLQAKRPRNNFPLVSDAQHYHFVAGGIGITPILSMIRWCEAYRKSWSLLYCIRSRVRAAFYEELLAFGKNVHFYIDDESEGKFVDMQKALANPKVGEHVYCCGPQSLMLAVEEATHDRLTSSVHFEWFNGRTLDGPTSIVSSSFEIVLKSSGARLTVAPSKTILETLEEHGVSVPFSCRDGLCRTCEIPLCAGEAEHRDYVLSEEERQSHKSIIICVSRACTPTLELGI